jgi:hypothetical protein
MPLSLVTADAHSSMAWTRLELKSLLVSDGSGSACTHDGSDTRKPTVTIPEMSVFLMTLPLGYRTGVVARNLGIPLMRFGTFLIAVATVAKRMKPVNEEVHTTPEIAHALR